MSEGSALLPDEPRTVGDQEGSLRRKRGRRAELIQRPPVREWLAVGILVWSLFLAACACSAYVQADLTWDGPSSSHPVPGWWVLMFGWMLGLLYWPVCFAWSANFLLLWGWVAYLRGRAVSAVVLGVAGAVAGFTTFAMPGSEVQRLLVVYYLWQASLLVFAVASGRHWWLHRARAGQSKA